jgi:general secretion pathway protein G
MLIPSKYCKPIKGHVPRRERSMRSGPVLPDFLVHRKPMHLVTVLIILVVIGAMVAGRAKAPRRKTIDRRPPFVAAREVEVLRVAVERFRADCGRYPTTEEGLIALIGNPDLDGWDGPYVTMIKRDPWTNQYVYASSGTNVALLSCGPDGRPGTADDILPDG